jgi:hypothetical protein
MSPDTPPLLAQLRQATKGLLLMSETDAPLKPFVWPPEHLGEAGITQQSVRAACGIAPDAPVEQAAVDELLGPSAAEEAWHDEEERTMARRFAQLVRMVESSLPEARVYKFGKARKEVVLVGRAEGGGYAGFITHVVET